MRAIPLAGQRQTRRVMSAIYTSGESQAVSVQRGLPGLCDDRFFLLFGLFSTRDRTLETWRYDYWKL